MFSQSVLRNDEKAIYSLRELYKTYGYMQYKVNKFEEYDLYAHNKSFLVSDKVLTFTDTNGKLMALKPDVTLSIVKNVAPEINTVSKFYYNENVYRPTTESNGFKEIMQTGLECIGRVTAYDECEVIMLAARSLETISEDYILDLSHMGLVEGLFESARLEAGLRKAIWGMMESKNVSGIQRLCAEANIDQTLADTVSLLTRTYLPLDKALAVIAPIISGEQMQAAYDELKQINDVMALYGMTEKLYLDFSVVNDQNYYDGIIFKGFLNGIPDSVLSGGRYDKLLAKMGKRASAIGFAVYLDRLERFGPESRAYDVDVMLLYDESADQKTIVSAVKSLTDSGNTVLALREIDPSIRCRAIAKLEDGEAKLL